MLTNSKSCCIELQERNTTVITTLAPFIYNGNSARTLPLTGHAPDARRSDGLHVLVARHLARLVEHSLLRAASKCGIQTGKGFTRVT